MAYTEQQLQQMGAKPVQSNGTSYTLSQLQQMGAKEAQPQSLTQQVLSGVGNYLGNTAKNIISAPVNLAAHTGEMIGTGLLGAADTLSGGALSRMTPEGDIGAATQRAMNTPDSLAGIPIKPISQETPESIAGEGLSTIALGAPGSGKFSAAGTGALAGALGGAGSSMQNNSSPLSVAGNTAVGGLLGYGTGLLGSGLSRAIAGPPDLNHSLWSAGAVADQPTSDALQSTLTDNGISSLRDREDVMFAKNVLSNSLRDSQNMMSNITPTDPISGESTPQAQNILDRMNKLQDALRAVTQVGHMIGPTVTAKIGGGAGAIASGVGLGSLASNTLSNVGSFLYKNFVGQNPLPGSFNP